MLQLMVTRELSADEKAVLEFLLSRPFPGRDQLRDQLESVRTTGLSCTCGCPSIALQVDRQAPRAQVGASIDAFGRDADGNLVMVGLLMDDGYMMELDFTDVAGTSKSGAPGFPDLKTLSLADQQQPEAGERFST